MSELNELNELNELTELNEVITDAGVTLKVGGGILSVDLVEIETRKDYRQLRADVYSVPVEYRENGLFVGYSAYGEPKEVPASSEFGFIGSINVPADDAAVLAQAKLDKVDSLNNEYESCAVIIKASYPKSERESWSIQAQESALFLNDPLSETPWLDSAAEARGISKEEMTRLIDPMDKLYRMNHGSLTGIRQRLRDDIMNCVDKESLDALDVISPLQEAKELMKAKLGSLVG